MHPPGRGRPWAGTESQSGGGGASAHDSHLKVAEQKVAHPGSNRRPWSLPVVASLVLLSFTLLLLLHRSMGGADVYARMQLLWAATPASASSPRLPSSPPSPWAPSGVNETERALEALRLNGTCECHRQRTAGSQLFLRQDAGGRAAAAVIGPTLRLEAGRTHELDLVSVTATGQARCSGGDFYEVDLAGPRWRSRPPTRDTGDGSYRIVVRVSAAEARRPRHHGDHTFNLTVVLLFDALHGMDAAGCGRWAVMRQTVFLRLVFFVPPAAAGRPAGLQPLELCAPEKGHFAAPRWSGRWTRGWVIETCTADGAGRFRDCVSAGHQDCTSTSDGDGDGGGEWWPWPACQGRVSRLESTGWVYSAHCAFRIWEAHEAWDRLAGKWLLFWCDSNFQDTIRNLLFFVLGYPAPQSVNLADWYLDRVIEERFVNPRRPDQALHITLIFNGHYNPYDNNLGLDCLLNDEYRESVARHFQGDRVPDVLVMTAGLHDGLHFPTLDAFAQAARRAARFWKDLLLSAPAGGAPGGDGRTRPQVPFKTAIAPAGHARVKDTNPHKMQLFNDVMVQSLQDAMPGVVGVLDAYDLSFPWHYDNNYSDGGHNGRPPLATLSPWLGKPHHYFVDVMLAHILVNAIQPANHSDST